MEGEIAKKNPLLPTNWLNDFFFFFPRPCYEKSSFFLASSPKGKRNEEERDRDKKKTATCAAAAAASPQPTAPLPLFSPGLGDISRIPGTRNKV